MFEITPMNHKGIFMTNLMITIVINQYLEIKLKNELVL